MLAIGLLGAGRIGLLHAANIASNADAQLAAVYDAVPAAAERLARRFGGWACSSVEEVLADSAVQAVFICSPTDTHVDLIARSAAAGKAVFCEKPIDLELARVRSCLEKLRSHPVPFTIGFHRRFDPHHRALRDAVRGGGIGTVEQMRVVSRDPEPPPVDYLKRSGGIFRDMMIHDLDQCRFILGEEFVGVFAKGDVLIDPAIGAAGDYDTATATFWTASGATCTIQNSRRATYGFDQRIEVFGSTGAAALDNVQTTRTSIGNGGGFTTAVLLDHFPTRYAEAYRLQLAAFVDAIKDGRSPETTAADGLRSLVLADAAGRSALMGAPVTIEWGE